MWTDRHNLRILRRQAGLLLAMFLLLPCLPAFALSVSLTYSASDAELVNPYIGNAVWANDDDEHEQPFTLVYANLLWSEFETEQGVYDFETFEEENQLDYWREQGKHLILRFVMDEPSTTKHIDIPQWLYDAIGGDGTFYNTPYGKGFSPNYANTTLIEAHAAAIAAIGERYGDDSFVAYIELGSLGHWGEWHVYDSIGLMPSASVYNQYVLPYLEAFPHAFLLMRRPFAIAAEYGLGLFNDTSGEINSTSRWLSWISDGGDYEAEDGDDDLVAMPDAWQTAPIGGELSTVLSRELLLDTLFSQTLSLFEQSHTSWIGPGSFADIERDGDYQDELDEILRTVGYRLRVSQCDVQDAEEGAVTVTLLFANDGIAPFYFDWTATLSVVDESGSETRYPLNLDLITILPDQPVSVSVTIPLPEGGCTIRVGIVDPSTDEAGVALAMDTQQEDLWYELIRLQGTQ